MEIDIEKIWLKISSGLKSYIRSKVNDNAAVEDIVQEVYLKIHSKIDTLKDGSKIQPWIYQIARNAITDHYRGTKRKVTIIEYPEDTAIQFVDSTMSEAIEDMIQMMDDLPPEYCEALCLTEIKGISQKEYAEKKGLSYSAAKSRVQRARKMLKDTMMKCCHYQFDKYGAIVDFHPITCCCCSQHQSPD